MKTVRFRSAHFGFTLIELLVVISIIAILASLAFTGVKGALLSARKVQAKNDMAQISSAITAYYTEYGKYPVDAAITTDAGAVYGTSSLSNAQVINVLRYDTSSTTTMTAAQKALNPRQIKFLEVAPKVGQKACVEQATGNWFDPWGSQYLIFIDADYGGEIDASKIGCSTTVQIGAGVASVGYYFVKNSLPVSGVPPTTFDKSYLISWQ